MGDPHSNSVTTIMKHALFIYIGTALGGLFGAPVDYTTSFSADESPAFADGRLDAQNSWVAHPIFSVSQSNGPGLVNQVNANGPVHLDSSADITSELAAGKTITLSLKFNFEGEFANQNDGAWLLGLSNDPGGMPEGPANTIGSAVFQNNTNSNFWLSPIAFPNGSKVDTEIPRDSGIHFLVVTITKSATVNEFAITANLDGRSTSYAMTHEGLWTGSDSAYAGFRFRGIQAGNIDSFSVSSTGNTGGETNSGITIVDTSYEEGTGVTIQYRSTVGPVDVFRNNTGYLDAGHFSLIASGVTGGTFHDDSVSASLAPKVFYLLVPEGNSPFGP